MEQVTKTIGDFQDQPTTTTSQTSPADLLPLPRHNGRHVLPVAPAARALGAPQLSGGLGGVPAAGVAGSARTLRGHLKAAGIQWMLPQFSWEKPWFFMWKPGNRVSS